MKNNRNLVIGILLRIISVIGLSTLSGMRPAMGSMMGGGTMMMNCTMMGARLPPGINPENLPDPQSTGAQLLAQYCTQCHGLPGPKQHAANEWPGVVERMTQNMKTMGKPIPDKETLKTVIEFLQTHAKQVNGKRVSSLSADPLFYWRSGRDSNPRPPA